MIYGTELSRQRSVFYIVECSLCGEESRMRKDSFERNSSGHCKKCGNNRSHGKKGTRLYVTWRNMKNRCSNPKNKDSPFYYDKGIRVCKKWKKSFIEFEKWALTNGYNDSLTIDRKNSNKNYKPSNCQWITMSENTSKASSERWDKLKRIAK